MFDSFARTHSSRNSYLVIGIALSSLIFVNTVIAEPAYRWEDSSGHIFFGSKPPANAKHVEKVAGKSFSRYSSDKLLKGYRSRLATPAASSRVREEDLKIDEATEPAIPVPELPQTQTAPANPLTQGAITVKLDSDSQLVECSVDVKNTSSSDANNVVVTFEFTDGSIVPALGPESIAASSEAKFSIPEEQLPLTLGTVAALAARNAKKSELETAAKPKVIINQVPAISDQG